ncbi:MAG: ABC transporter ATP-binding protein [Candidatus Poribacteria bacterium]|nr:ABC transporter ATP-binding protein [Candidatus Poribacteria bacterium]
MTTFQRYLRLFQPHAAVMVFTIFLAVVTTTMQAVSLHIMADIVNVVANEQGAAAFPTTAKILELNPIFGGITRTLANEVDALKMLAVMIGVIVAIIFAKGFIVFGKSYLIHRVTYRVMTDSRNRLHEKILSLPIGLLNRQRTGDLMARSVDDVRVLTESIHAFSNVIQSSVTVLIFLSYMLLKSWTLTVGTLIFVPLIAYFIHEMGTRIRRASSTMQKELGAVSTRLQEGIVGLKVIKGFGVERLESERFGRETKAMYRTAMRRVRVYSLQSPVTEFVMALGMTGVFGIGCWLILKGSLRFGDLLLHLALAGVLIEPAKTVGNFNALFQQGLASIERITDIMDLPSEDFASGKPIDNVRGDVTFEDVTFRYDDGDAPVLRDISFEAKAGQTVALVGRSGAGKTTLLQLIPRLFTPTSGRILLDGVPADEIALASLRHHISLVPQETVLFAGSIEDNIRLGKPDATFDDVEHAAKNAYAHEFVMAFPDGYRTMLGERGVRLSGGQQQRISIARAFLKDPRVFLLDEATASLDSESEQVIQKSFDRLRQDRTAIVIAHRLSTILHADLILVIDDGQVLESGTHAQLIERNGIYTRLYETQFQHEASRA